MVAMPKANSDQIRICVDPTKLNENVMREKHPLLPLEESLSRLAGGGQYFGKLDANTGFWQIMLAPESQLLTSFITPLDWFCFNRLPMGISSAREFFRKKNVPVTWKRPRGSLPN